LPKGRLLYYLDWRTINKIEKIYPDYLPKEVGGGISTAIKSSNKVGYVSVSTTANFVYLLYSGIPISDYIANNKSVAGNNLFIYSWNGIAGIVAPVLQDGGQAREALALFLHLPWQLSTMLSFIVGCVMHKNWWYVCG
jgi:hypothetical protein